MITDETLQAFIGNEWLYSGDADFGAEIIEMAIELLSLREYKRNNTAEASEWTIKCKAFWESEEGKVEMFKTKEQPR